jgi:hypothetical protein
MNIIDVSMLAASKVIMHTILLKYGSKAIYNTPSLEPILILVSSTSNTLAFLQIHLSENRKHKDLNHDRIDV